MGGRGAGSGANTLAKQNTHADIAAYMQKNHGVTIDSSLINNTSVEQLRSISEQVEGLLREFPQLRNIPDASGGQKTRDAVKTLGAGQLKAGTVAQAGFDGRITFNTSHLSKGQLQRGTANHETGHLIERALILKNEKTRLACGLAWNKCTYATQVIGEACKNLKKMPQYKGMTNDQFVRQVSRYAMTNRSEALAECVRDYAHKRDNATPLAKEVWKILKRELG